MQTFQEIVTVGLIGIMSFFGYSFDALKDAFPTVIEKISTTPESKSIDTQTPTPTSTPISAPLKITPPKTPSSLPTKTLSTPAPTPVPPPQQPVVSPSPASVTATAPTAPRITQNRNATTEEKIKSAVGNIFCTSIEGGHVRKITGSAVAISNNGVMLTNAHVAQHLLLQNTGAAPTMSCFVRTGAPAARAYTASVVYLPSEWIALNKSNLHYLSVSGTGENDYALIVLQEKINASASNLSYIEGDDDEVKLEASIFLAGYPAFGGNIIDNALYPVIQNSEIKERWRLNHSESDLMGTSPTILAVNGSSGGAATNSKGKLMGIMVATTLDAYSNKPNMRLISYGYISKDIKSKTGKSLDSFIKNAESESATFIQGTGRTLAQTLISN